VSCRVAFVTTRFEHIARAVALPVLKILIFSHEMPDPAALDVLVAVAAHGREQHWPS